MMSFLTQDDLFEIESFRIRPLLYFGFKIMVRFAVAFMMVPLWLVIGFATFGLLLPPQVRGFFLVQKPSTLEQTNKVVQQISDLRQEVKTLRDDVTHKIKHEKWEIEHKKVEADKAQQELLADVLQMKEIMITLLNKKKNELQR
eukprot:CAMPEP_0172512488 /NCGR_PEP_ID=MMETSP1066-20121228/245108_1 /TAXON_ID=671091 /ORGANISM="Coscinodiscus wailesii, Strain CCMP2513" /LENGTH=143 /DNA_ID=CAMNT_0013292335 /DNA_START=99 /DNA_END=530 /DNA_ORIENTATION=-